MVSLMNADGVPTTGHLVSDHRNFCQLAYERNSLLEVANLLTSVTPLEKTPESEEDEPYNISRLREVNSLIRVITLLWLTDVFAYRQLSPRSPRFRSSTTTSAPL